MRATVDSRLDQRYLIGFSITPEELLARVKNYISSADVTGWNNLGTALNTLRSDSELRWANPLEVKNAVEQVFLEKFGPKEAAKPKTKVHVVPLIICNPTQARLSRNRRRILRNLPSKRVRWKTQQLLAKLSLRKVSWDRFTSLERTLRSIPVSGTNISQLPRVPSGRDSRQNPMDICTLDTLKLSSLILAMQPTTGESAIFGMMTPIPRRRRRDTLRAFWRWSGGSVSSHGRSLTRVTISMSYMILQWS